MINMKHKGRIKTRYMTPDLFAVFLVASLLYSEVKPPNCAIFTARKETMAVLWHSDHLRREAKKRLDIDRYTPEGLR